MPRGISRHVASRHVYDAIYRSLFSVSRPQIHKQAKPLPFPCAAGKEAVTADHAWAPRQTCETSIPLEIDLRRGEQQGMPSRFFDDCGMQVYLQTDDHYLFSAPLYFLKSGSCYLPLLLPRRVLAT